MKRRGGRPTNPAAPQTPAWRNWQTRWTQNPVIARSCGFDPLRRHSLQVAFYQVKHGKKVQVSGLARIRTKTKRIAVYASTRRQQHWAGTPCLLLERLVRKDNGAIAL